MRVDIFENRRDAGRRLGEVLRERLASADDVLVVGIAGGGAPVAQEVAARLDAQLDILQIPSGQHLPVSFHDRFVVLVDDGIATGRSMREAIELVEPAQPRRLILAAPVGDAATCEDLAAEADDVAAVVTLFRPERFINVAQYYRDFTEVSEGELDEIYRQAERGGVEDLPHDSE